VAQPWVMETGSFAAAGGCGPWRAGAFCGICPVVRGVEGACSQRLPPVVTAGAWTVRGRVRDRF